MKPSPLALATAAALGLAATGCPDQTGNPGVLWLAPNNSEVVIMLSGKQPNPW